MDRLTSMRVFEKVASLRSFSGAARELGMSQATASKHIQTLEDWIGQRLFDRTTRRVDLTPYGQGFHPQCLRILEEVIDARTGPNPREITGTICLSAPVAFASNRLGALLSQFRALHPGVRFDVLAVDRAVEPSEEGLELAFIMGGAFTPSATVRSHDPIPVTVCAAPAYLAAFGRLSEPADLAHAACLVDGVLIGDRWRFAGARGEDVIAVKGPLRSNNVLLVRDAALAGDGVMAAPSFLVEADITQGRLVRVLENHVMTAIPLTTMLAPSRQASAKMRVFLAFLDERLSDGPRPN